MSRLCGLTFLHSPAVQSIISRPNLCAPWGCGGLWGPFYSILIKSKVKCVRDRLTFFAHVWLDIYCVRSSWVWSFLATLALSSDEERRINRLWICDFAPITRSSSDTHFGAVMCCRACQKRATLENVPHDHRRHQNIIIQLHPPRSKIPPTTNYTDNDKEEKYTFPVQSAGHVNANLFMVCRPRLLFIIHLFVEIHCQRASGDLIKDTHEGLI